MKIKALILFLLVGSFACNTNSGENNSQVKFDQAKWKTKEGKDYPYRDKMVDDVLYSDSLRTLTKDEILDLLGEPDRTNENYLYYRITEKRLASWTLHQKNLVFKFSEADSVEWIKLHE